jgi:serine-type D-Ala-D-Ala endopeptidase (penicillin-binding protein 7)
MRIKLISLLLLSHALIAQAADNVQNVAIQNADFIATQVEDLSEDEQDDDEQTYVFSSENEQDFSDELAAVDEQAPNTVSKAYDDLAKVMPQHASTINSIKQKEEVKQAEATQQNAFDMAVMKFAKMPRMRSSIVMIYDEAGKQVLHSHNANVVAPIASITKLMTAMVVLDANLPLDEEISISASDISKEKRSRSRTRVGMTLTRGELLKLALMSSDNLSAAALARTYPGGTEAAMQQMNIKAQELGMSSSRFMDPTGLHSGNVSTANDLVKMVRAAHGYELIHEFSTATSHYVERGDGRRPVRFGNTNPLVKSSSWDIGLSKTGYIKEAGRCLVMEAKISEHPVIIVLLDSWGKKSRVVDANRVKTWMEKASLRVASVKNM